MRLMIFILAFIPSVCFANTDIREMYISAVEDFSTCGVALMPWGSSEWRPDEAEKLYVEKARVNQDRMRSEIDKNFYTEANLQKLFVELTDTWDFLKKKKEHQASAMKMHEKGQYKQIAQFAWNCLLSGMGMKVQIEKRRYY